MRRKVCFWRGYGCYFGWCGPCSFVQTLTADSCRVADEKLRENSMGGGA